jgi:hypothetical protein
MKLILYANWQDVPSRCIFKYSVNCTGNPFSNEKSARLLIEQCLNLKHRTLPNIAIHIRDTNGRINNAYIVNIT